MHSRILILLGLAACLIFASSASADSSENYRIDWMVPLSSAGDGHAAREVYTASMGYWYQEVTDWLIMLPAVFRDTP